MKNKTRTNHKHLLVTELCCNNLKANWKKLQREPGWR